MSYRKNRFCSIRRSCWTSNWIRNLCYFISGYWIRWYRRSCTFIRCARINSIGMLQSKCERRSCRWIWLYQFYGNPVFLTNRITTKKTESRAINKEEDLSETSTRMTSRRSSEGSPALFRLRAERRRMSWIYTSHFLSFSSFRPEGSAVKIQLIGRGAYPKARTRAPKNQEAYLPLWSRSCSAFTSRTQTG